MDKVQPLRTLFAHPEGRLELIHKLARPNWFDGREMKVTALSQGSDAVRTILFSVSGPAGEFHLPLSAGEAARLMFEIGYALEQAAEADRSHCDARVRDDA